MQKILYETTQEFDKDLKRLLKKYRTLKEDIEVLKKASLEFYHKIVWILEGFSQFLAFVLKK